MSNQYYQVERQKYQGIHNVTPWQLSGRLENMIKYSKQLENKTQKNKK
jgi:hypothetical protein